MSGQPIEEAKNSICSILQIDENPSVIVFNSDAETLDFENKKFEEKKQKIMNIQSTGGTDFNKALLKIKHVIECGKKNLKENYFIIFLSDGQNTSGSTELTSKELLNTLTTYCYNFEFHCIGKFFFLQLFFFYNLIFL
jgi:uncharacterized protein with von Willebrand factor type A (vWA) domain